MITLVNATSPPASEPSFAVIHQKVELDVGLLSRSLEGRTELTVDPHSRDLRVIRLNCRHCELKRVTVNGKPAPNPNYQDPYSRAVLPWKAGVNQHHMLRKKLEGQWRNPPERELIITLPKGFKIDELDPYSAEAANSAELRDLAVVKKSFGDGNTIDITQGPRSTFEQTNRYNPITIVIEYAIKDIRDGMHFVGWEEGDLRYPHAYSKNSALPGSACCLFPCVDDLTSRPTWEISIKCSRTIGDAVKQCQQANPRPLVNGKVALSNGLNERGSDLEGSTKRSSFSDEDQALELAVICTGDMTDEVCTKRTNVILDAHLFRW